MDNTLRVKISQSLKTLLANSCDLFFVHSGKRRKIILVDAIFFSVSINLAILISFSLKIDPSAFTKICLPMNHVLESTSKSHQNFFFRLKLTLRYSNIRFYIVRHSILIIDLD